MLRSTGTGLLKVTSDLLLTARAGECSILILLDLSEAFDTVDHASLIDCLKHWLGIRDTALCWLSYYISHRTFSFTVGSLSSSLPDMTCGVPQGSVLSPIFFSLYNLSLGCNFDELWKSIDDRRFERARNKESDLSDNVHAQLCSPSLSL